MQRAVDDQGEAPVRAVDRFAKRKNLRIVWPAQVLLRRVLEHYSTIVAAHLCDPAVLRIERRRGQCDRLDASFGECLPGDDQLAIHLEIVADEVIGVREEDCPAVSQPVAQ